jgi:hypothetical protein
MLINLSNEYQIIIFLLKLLWIPKFDLYSANKSLSTKK